MLDVSGDFDTSATGICSNGGGGGGDTNTAPIAYDDSYITPYNTDLLVTAPGVLGNDKDAENDGLSATLTGDGPSHGSLIWKSDGSFTYTPNFNYFGHDTFTYVASDVSLTSNEATVTITVESDGGGTGTADACDGLAEGVHLTPFPEKQGGPQWKAIVDAMNCDAYGDLANFSPG